ncbi:MAG TPA: HAD hydrolase-like protein [Conexibacter sp.]|nr:HAD hydrolase-like protein [Conexibacter sp.]
MLADARGFAFDLDGTLVQRGANGPEPLPRAREVLDAVRASGRPLVVFTNASHATPATLAERVSAGGLPLAEQEVLTPICSAIGELRHRHAGRSVYAFATPATRERLLASGVELLADADAVRAEVVLVAHADDAPLATMEAAARAVRAGARLLTANYAPAYAGADGPIISRGAMITAAIARAAQTRPLVVGKPSHAALRALVARLALPARELVIVGDDLGMDVALGRLGGARTILVRSGISGDDEVARAPAGRRPDRVVDEVGALLELP